jgi:4-hydroxy-3-polyprenylbenzoate decarboxylase
MIRRRPSAAPGRGYCKFDGKEKGDGAVLMPPVPAFYTRLQTIDDLVSQTVGRILDQFGIETGILSRSPCQRQELHRKTTERDENLERSNVPS